jgi:uncharacterized protein (UPF0335 family)
VAKKKESWIAKIEYLKEDYNKLFKICSDIYARDKTFIFTFEPKNGKGILRIWANDKDTAFKRAMWLVHKTECELTFKVEKEEI